jgi:hypothetical protein
MSWDVGQLDLLLENIWDALTRAGSDLNHPFRIAALTTQDGIRSAARTVILREADPATRRLSCYTDYRSAKVKHIGRCPQVEWLFYDPTTRVQVRARGDTTLQHGEPAAQAAWQALPLPSRMQYCSPLTPGTKITKPEEAWPQFVLERHPTVEAVKAGWNNFAILHTSVEDIDFLHLDWTVQRRATFAWAQNRFNGNWVAP